MKKTLLDATQIGEFLTVGAEMEGEEIGLFIASADVSSSCAFKSDEWGKFVAAVNEADKAFKKA